MNAINHFDFGPVNVTANHAISLMAAGHGGERFFVFRDEFYSRLGFELQKRRQRPVTKPKRTSQPVEVQVKVEDPVVKVGTQLFEQMVKVGKTVRLMAVDDQILFAIRSRVHGFTGHGHAAETHAYELLDKFVVVAGNINDLGMLAAFAEQLLDEHVIVIAPEPAELELPTVYEIAYEI